MGRSKRPKRNVSLRSEPQTRIERQATIELHHQIGPRYQIGPRHQIEPWFQIGPRSPTEPELESESQPTDDLTRTQSTRPISPTPLAQTREEVTELQGMVSTLIDKSRNQETAYRTIVNRLDQAERELAEHRVSARERNQPLTGPSGVTPNPLNLRAFNTLEFPALDPVATWEKTHNEHRNKAWPTEA
ncbi:hypothetical protein DY000_02052669 [Brassica cretica]|uniref:Uncharacterized protein n=1 Tax=Brassica cretica TaxID=69181 RepID=A0ABQ7A529_BRACR|nr:hypothetical protein DY000_02052669 [Brassica cretica]